MGDSALTSENASPTTTYVRIPHKQPVTTDDSRTPSEQFAFMPRVAR